MSKVIVITGAGAGMGRMLARRFGADGETVILLGRTLTKVEAVAEEIGGEAMAVECDVASPDSVRSAFARIADRHPRIDVLINNAAVYQPFLVADARDEQILDHIGINLAGPILCTRSAIPLLGRGGHIINVSSESVEVPFPHLTLYQATKGGLETFSKMLQLELATSGVRVTVVRAGPMHEEDKTWSGDPVAARAFAEAAARIGIHLRERPGTHVKSTAGIFRMLIDLPDDLQVGTVTLHGWRSR